MGIVRRTLARLASSAAAGVRPVARGTYLVVPGDNLWKIAKREYGDANWWYELFIANRRLVKSPDLVHAGMTLRLP
jgi:nucleoid-associated protein YgaU